MVRGLLCLLLAGCAADPPAPWVPLFDGAQLGGWSPTPFGGEGEVRVEDGRLVLEVGTPLTGVTWTGTPPSGDYQLELAATRLAGDDFFLGLTFPVGAGHATLVLGGWGGALCGLSCLDGADASENETKSFRAFEDDRPYHVALRVEGARVSAWLDGEVLFDVDTTVREVSLRTEVVQSAPLGLATFLTRAAYTDLRWRAD